MIRKAEAEAPFAGNRWPITSVKLNESHNAAPMQQRDASY